MKDLGLYEECITTRELAVFIRKEFLCLSSCEQIQQEVCRPKSKPLEVIKELPCAKQASKERSGDKIGGAVSMRYTLEKQQRPSLKGERLNTQGCPPASKCTSEHASICTCTPKCAHPHTHGELPGA